MKYQIIGASKLTKETKKGKHYRVLTVMNPMQATDFEGINAEKITLWDSQLEVTSIETYNGKFFDAKDGKEYYIDIDYSASGWVMSARVYNS